MKCYVKSVGGPRASRGIIDLTTLALLWERPYRKSEIIRLVVSEMERAIYQKLIEINGRRYGIWIMDLLHFNKLIDRRTIEVSVY